jgi:hypothetical protein
MDIPSEVEHPSIANRVKDLFSRLPLFTSILCGLMVLFWLIGLFSRSAIEVIALIPAKYFTDK